MYKASVGVTLPTSIIGSLPRPSWYTAGLGSQSFLEAMMNLRYREQYEDAVSVYLRAQETAGLDICTDGDAHFDEQISGMSWQSYPLTHMAGFFTSAEPTPYQMGTGAPRGHILHDFLEARVLPKIVGPVGPGNLQYAAMWRVAQRLTQKPVKFGTILPELLAASVADEYYKDPVERVWALSDALNSELGELADAGCPVIQLEEPQIHMVPVRGKPFGKLDTNDLVKLFNNTVKGLRGKTEVWCHTCWGNIDHHTLQVERPDQVADLIREALKYIPPERLIISSDCSMGREGMSRGHATYKMVAMVLGTNIVRKELGLPEAECLAADPRFSLARDR